MVLNQTLSKRDVDFSKNLVLVRVPQDALYEPVISQAFSICPSPLCNPIPEREQEVIAALFRLVVSVVKVAAEVAKRIERVALFLERDVITVQLLPVPSA